LVPSTVKLLYRQTKKGPVREVQQSTKRKKEVTERLEYQPQTSKSTRHRHVTLFHTSQARTVSRTSNSHCFTHPRLALFHTSHNHTVSRTSGSHCSTHLRLTLIRAPQTHTVPCTSGSHCFTYLGSSVSALPARSQLCSPLSVLLPCVRQEAQMLVVSKSKAAAIGHTEAQLRVVSRSKLETTGHTHYGRTCNEGQLCHVLDTKTLWKDNMEGHTTRANCDTYLIQDVMERQYGRTYNKGQS